MKMDSMYQEIILDHYKHPHHKGLLEPVDAEVHHINPTCGDEVTLRVRLDGSTVADVSYDSQGCSISQASASVLTDLVVGKTVGEAQPMQEAFLELMQSQGPGRGRRGGAGGRRRVRRSLQVPGPGQVRAARLDGLEGRHRPGAGRHPCEGERMSETTAESAAESSVEKAEEGATTFVGTTAGTVAVDDLMEALRDVVDPELGINVVDLGLIYGVHVDESDVATIDMTLTSAACPLTDVIEDQARTATDGLVQRPADQLGLDAAVGPGQDHRRRS